MPTSPCPRSPWIRREPRGLPIFLGVTVWSLSVRSTTTQNGLGAASGSADWALEIAYAEREAVRKCNAVFAAINGQPPDEGVAVELGKCRLASQRSLRVPRMRAA